MNRRTRTIINWQLVAVILITLTTILNLTNHASAQNCQLGWVNRTFPNQIGPFPRYNMAMAYDSNRKVTVLFGGQTITQQEGFKILSDTWEYDGSNWVKISVDGPGQRYGATMTYDQNRGVSILFGGYDGVNFLSDTWEWNGNSWTKKNGNTPPARISAAMAYDSKRGVTLLTGGAVIVNNRSINFNDLWTWDGSTWQNITPPGKRPTAVSSMTYDPDRDRMIVFGKQDNTTPDDLFPFSYNRIWEWDGQAWSHSNAIGPVGSRGKFQLVYDSQLKRTVFFGSDRHRLQSDTWEWDGQFWYLVSDDGPVEKNTGEPGRYDQAMTYDQNRGQVVLFGGRKVIGNTFYTFEDTWEYNGSTGVELFDLPAPLPTLKRGETAVLSVKTDRAIGTPHFQWQKDFIDLTDDGRITGSNTNTLTIRNVSAEDIASYSIVVEDDCHRIENSIDSLDVIDPVLTVTADCPGNRVSLQASWEHATPDGEIAILYSPSLGSAVIPEGNPCAGTTLDLNRVGLRVALQATSTNVGTGNINEVRFGVCGNYLQLIDLDTCLTSNVVQIQ